MENQGNFLNNQNPYQMGNLKRINEKRKLIDDLTLFLNSNKNLINDPINQDKFSELYQVLLTLLNENNNSFISAEINLLKLMSENIKNNQQFGQFLIASLPKLFDKFYLQNPKINKELVNLFNIFVKNGLKIENFFPNIENMSMEEDDNYKVPLLDFLYSQIQNNSNLNMNSIPKSISNLLKRLSNDTDNEVSNIAFNSLETLNIRMGEMNSKERDQKSMLSNPNEIEFSSLINAITQAVKSDINEQENNQVNNNQNNKIENNNIYNNLSQSPNQNSINNTVFNNNMNQLQIPNMNNNVYYNSPQLQNNNMINNMLQSSNLNLQLNPIQNQIMNNNLNYNQMGLQNPSLNNNIYNNQMQLPNQYLNNNIQMGQLQNQILQSQYLNNNIQLGQMQNPNLNNNINLLQNQNLNNNIFNNQLSQLQNPNINSNLNNIQINQFQNPNLNNQRINDVNMNINKYNEINQRNNEIMNQNNSPLKNDYKINIQKDNEYASNNNNYNSKINKENEEIKPIKIENNEIKKENNSEKENIEKNIEEIKKSNKIEDETKKELEQNQNKKEEKEIEEKKENIQKEQEKDNTKSIQKKNEEEETKTDKKIKEEQKIEEKKEEPKLEEKKEIEDKKEIVKNEDESQEVLNIEPNDKKKKNKPALKRVNKFRKMFGKENNQNKDFVLVEKPMKNENESNNINESKEIIENKQEEKKENETQKKIEVNINNKFKQEQNYDERPIKTMNNISKDKIIQEEENKKLNNTEKKNMENKNLENNEINNNKNKKEEDNLQLVYDEIPINQEKKNILNINEKKEELTNEKTEEIKDEKIKEKNENDKNNNNNNEKIETTETKKPIDLDDRPIKPTKNNFVNRPIKKMNIDIDERPIKPASKNPYDEIPIKGIQNKKEEINTPPPEENTIELDKNGNNINDDDYRPIKSSNYDFDELPIKSKLCFDDKIIKPKPIEIDDSNTLNNNNHYDEKPIKNIDDIPIKNNKENENVINENEEENFIVDKNTKKNDNFIKKKMPNRFKKDNKKIEVNQLNQNKKKNENNVIEEYRNTIPVSLNIEDMPLTNEEKTPVKNQEKSMDEFEKKLQLALEQEKDGLLNINQTHNTKPTTQNKKEDPKYDEIKSILGSDIVNNLNSNKWEEKKNGFELINQFIENNSNKFNVNDLIQYIKFKLKDFKETNFNIVREVINVFNNLITKKLLDKENSIMILNAYYEKLVDIKIKEQINQMLLNLIDSIGPEQIMLNIIPKLIKKPNVKLLNEYSVFFGKIIDDYDINGLPIKDCVDLCKTMANNANPQVRTSATSLLCIIYKYVGNELRKMIKDIKESTLKIIEAELDKVQVIDKKSPDLKKKKKVGGEDNKNVKKLELIPIVDISKKITSQMLKDIKSGKWPEKKEACENIEKILENANMKILPNGLNDLFNLIKEKLSDGNKNIVRMIISLLNKLIEALGSGFKQYTKNIALALIPNLADKMQMLREDCQNCLDKWVEFTGFDTVIIYFPNFLKTENVEIRTEILCFIRKYKEKFNKVLGENVFKDMVNPLLLCLQDRASSVRLLAEDILKFSLGFINMNNYERKLKDFKPAIQKDLKLILDRIQNESNTTEDDSQVNNTINNNNVSIEKNDSIRLIEKNNVNDDKGQRESPLKKRRGHQLSNDDVIHSVNNKSSILSKEKTTVETKLETNSTVLKNNIKISNSRDKKKITKFNYSNQIQVFINNIKVTPNKNKRLEQDRKYKFSLETVSRDYSQKLKEQVKSLFNEDFIKKIFSDDFKQQAEAIKNLKNVIDKNDNNQIIFDNIDLILKTIGIKMNNQNPSLLKSLFEFLDKLLNLITTNNYILTDIEGNMIISMLIDKLTITTNNLRDHLLKLIHNYIKLIGAKNIIVYLINYSLGKNTRIKSEVLDLVIDLYLNEQIDICQRTTVRLLSKFLSVNDNNIKNKVIDLFKEIYSYIHNELWNFIDVNEKDREFLKLNLLSDEENELEEEEEEEEESETKGEESEENDNNNSNNNYQNNNNTIIVQQHINNGNQQIININGIIKDKNELIITMNNLLTNNEKERVDAIIIIHDLICAKYEDNKKILIENIDEIIRIFITVMKNLFNTNDITTIPIKFSKYLATVLCKIASNKELISNISYDVLYELSEELLSNLLIENLDKIGNNQEGSIIFKSFNSTMLRILENCNSTNVILVLLDLIKTYRTKGEKSKVAGLAIKCLLKVNQNLATIINSISVDKILLQIHILLIDFEQTQPDLTPKTQTDQMIIRFIKNLINDLCKIKSSKIILDYDLVKKHGVNDKYIIKWIKNNLNIILNFDKNTNLIKKYSTNQQKENNQPSNQLSNSSSSRQYNISSQNSNSNPQINTHDFNNTMSQLKKKWNDINRNSTNINKK